MNAPLMLHDTRSRTRRRFAPADPTNVRMYVCGPTVYDLAHIGNARPIIVFDVVFRLLRHLYGEAHVTYVRNITDVEDKINARAAERGMPIDELTRTTIADFHADIAALHCLAPTVEPRATGHIAEMRALIDRLVDNGHAYVAEDHVLFSVASLPGYGTLARRSLDEMIAGARVEVAPYKRDGLDFVLWKPSRKGEPAWPSPAGIAMPGRPGWHIECSAMAHRHLGERFDIHGGGIDLAFPHHENERAQTLAAFGIEEMASFWLHNGFLQVEGRKMSKSEGNFVTIRDALATASGDTLRLAMLMTQYRQPLNWTAARVAEAETMLGRWAEAAIDAPSGAAGEGADEEVLAALRDDLNTPAAVARLNQLARTRDPALGPSAALLGLDPQRAAREIAAVRQARTGALQEDAARAARVEAKVAERLAAKAARRFADADRIRDELAREGIVLKDGKAADGSPRTTWEYAG